MRCTSYSTAGSYNLLSLFQSLQKKEKAQLFRNVLHIQKNKGHIFYFSYGVIVCWGLTEKEELLTITQLKKYEDNTYQSAEIDEFTYNYGDAMRISDDDITLQNDSTLTKFSISHGIAQSVKLTIFEERIHRVISRTRSLPEQLASKGKISMSRKEISRKMGSLSKERHFISLGTEIFETPEFFWEHPDLEPYYQRTAHYLEINKRVEALNKRLQVMHELFEILNNQLQHQHSSRLEWTIIILILIEVVLGVLRDVFHVI